MGHNHKHTHGAHHETKNIKVAFFLNLVFTIIEIIGGILTNSMAILSDALHDLGDSFSLGMSWYFQNLSNKKPNDKFTYGYSRFSLLGALLNSVILFAGSIFIIYKSTNRIMHPEEVEEVGMMYLAILGIIVNGAAVLKLKRGTSINERVVSLHLLEDVLGWVVVLVASIIMQFVEVPWLDAALSLGIAGYILFNVYKNLKDSLRVVLQASPIEGETDVLHKKIEQELEGGEIRDFHLWSLDGEYHICTIHIKLAKEISCQEQDLLRAKIKGILVKDHIVHTTIEFQMGEEGCELASTGSVNGVS